MLPDPWRERFDKGDPTLDVDRTRSGVETSDRSGAGRDVHVRLATAPTS
jgi:hypothetical protein